MGKIVTFVSGKGGTGKTSMCAAVVSCLSAMGDRVLCIDADVGLRNLDLALGMSDAVAPPFTCVMRGEVAPEELPGEERLRGLRLLTAPVGLSAEEIDADAFAAMLARCREDFDWCLIDAPAGIGAGFRLACMTADEAIVVTGADAAAMRDGSRAAQLLPEGLPARVLVNRVSRPMYRRMQKTVDDVMDTVGLPLLGIVPEDIAVPLSAANGIPLVLEQAKGASAACLRIARRLKGIKTPLTAR
ncbi:MAG: AAA family ATPase [Oscillospiraceae bacterium]|nr:AAA family ATPase [Oscillospiraceae bacterium]